MGHGNPERRVVVRCPISARDRNGSQIFVEERAGSDVVERLQLDAAVIVLDRLGHEHSEISNFKFQMKNYESLHFSFFICNLKFEISFRRIEQPPLQKLSFSRLP